MGKCKHYHEVSYRGNIYDPVIHVPIPQTLTHGACIKKDNERCECDGEESRCDYFPKIRAREKIGCETCRYFDDSDDACRLKNCHRAFNKAELENKDFVTDAWAKK